MFDMDFTYQILSLVMQSIFTVLDIFLKPPMDVNAVLNLCSHGVFMPYLLIANGPHTILAVFQKFLYLEEPVMNYQYLPNEFSYYK